ncbi:hypothetical protein HHI36_000614 [Cryptolaemus montrouzieri]|uniref:JmjC domain-containing protein n=1 Tax=Cryptolaemus montrouzieri TaxID=559131 RepID=A0ABD2P5L1_9CUCU
MALTKDLNNLIFKTNEPIILKGCLKWQIFQWDLDKWNDILKHENLEFRCGVNDATKFPQWERTTQMTTGKFEDLHKLSDPLKWLYFDYKYLNQWFMNAKELRESINFKDLGLENVDVNQSTIWIGSNGAHTPCHIDTYGCNVVVQVLGRKRWLLFPFNEKLKPTRVPYEESSVYSGLNFFSPNSVQDFEDISVCKIVTLNPGDVLIVPHKWWHYVENLEISISINTWLPLPQDDKERINECLVQMLVTSFTKDLDKEKQDIILNPNSDDLRNSSLDSGITLFNNLVAHPLSRRAVEDRSFKFDLDILLNQYKFIRKIENVSKENFRLFLENQRNRFSSNCVDDDYSRSKLSVEKLIQAITHPEVVNLIMNKILE